MNPPPVEHRPLPRWSAVVLVAIATWVAMVEATTAPWALNPDGIAYLDQAAAWRAGDITQAISSYWSPGYPLLLAIWGVVTLPLGLTLIPGAHALNVVIAAAFAWAAARLHRELDEQLASDGVNRGKRWVVWTALVPVVTLVVAFLSPPTLLTPDLMMATLLLVVATSAIRLHGVPSAPAWSWLGLGLLTGMVYLTKTPGLPVGLVLVACAAVGATGTTLRTVVWRGIWAALGCAILLLPWATALSRADGRLTLGSSATLNRAWSWKEGTARAAGAQQEPEVRSVPPEAYGTFPRWYAPQRFISKSASPGVLSVRRAGEVFWGNLQNFEVVRWHLLLLVCAGSVVLARLAGLPRESIQRVAVLLIPPLAGSVMYLFVHVEGRYYGSFLVLAVLAACSAAVAVVGVRGWALTTTMMASVLLSVRPLASAQKVPLLGPYTNPYQPVIDKLRSVGVASGGSIAVVGDPYRAYWALPAGVRIAATLELPTATLYYNSPPEMRARWEDAFRAAGAEAVVLTHGQLKATVLPLPATSGP